MCFVLWGMRREQGNMRTETRESYGLVERLLGAFGVENGMHAECDPAPLIWP